MREEGWVEDLGKAGDPGGQQQRQKGRWLRRSAGNMCATVTPADGSYPGEQSMHLLLWSSGHGHPEPCGYRPMSTGGARL